MLSRRYIPLDNKKKFKVRNNNKKNSYFFFFYDTSTFTNSVFFVIFMKQGAKPIYELIYDDNLIHF